MTPSTTALRDRLEPLLAGDPRGWLGLPPARVSDFDALFGAPHTLHEDTLGVVPALRRAYRDAQGRGLALWSREDIAVMVAAETLPPPALLADLPAPDRVLPHEILLPGHYAHEYLYCGIGLVLTVAQLLREGPARIARCRGIAPLASPHDFGPNYYLAFEDQTSWAQMEVPA